MPQYHPFDVVKNIPPLNRTLLAEEYQKVTDAFYALGFHNGWLQELESYENYLPDFDREHPFEP
jgi:putative pyruvate formate lyase activating enzyme